MNDGLGSRGTTRNRGEEALSMVLNILTMIGMVNLIFFTRFGIFSWPMDLIRGTRSARSQSEEIQEQHLINPSEDKGCCCP